MFKKIILTQIFIGLMSYNVKASEMSEIEEILSSPGISNFILSIQDSVVNTQEMQTKAQAALSELTMEKIEFLKSSQNKQKENAIINLLFITVLCGDTQKTTALINASKDNHAPEMALIQAAIGNKQDLIDYLLENHPTQDALGLVIYGTIAGKHYEYAQKLLDENPQYIGKAIAGAAIVGDLDFTGMLLEKEHTPEDEGMGLMSAACAVQWATLNLFLSSPHFNIDYAHKAVRLCASMGLDNMVNPLLEMYPTGLKYALDGACSNDQTALIHEILEKKPTAQDIYDCLHENEYLFRTIALLKSYLRSLES